MKIGIDAHCHIEHMEDPDAVASEVGKRMQGAICSVPDPKDFGKIMDIHRRHPKIAVCLGFHPEIAEKYSDDDISDCIEKIKEHAASIVGIGEIGLDYHWVRDTLQKERCERIFSRFIDLANSLRLPVVIHTRNTTNSSSNEGNAIDDALKILADNDARSVMMHCFSGNERQMDYALGQGYMISFATIITRSEKHKRLAKICPMDRMLLETDAPWLDPDIKPIPGQRLMTNRPWKIDRSAMIIGELKSMTPLEILQQTARNAKDFFNLNT